MDKARFPDSPDEIFSVRISRELWLGDDPDLAGVRVWCPQNAEEFRPVEIHEQAGYSIADPGRPVEYSLTVYGPTEEMLVRTHDGPVTKEARLSTSFCYGYMCNAPLEDIPPGLVKYLLFAEGLIARQDVGREYVRPIGPTRYRWQNLRAPAWKRPPEAR